MRPGRQTNSSLPLPSTPSNMFSLSATRGNPPWGWGNVLQPVLEYPFLALALLIFFTVWIRWFCPRTRQTDVEAQVIHNAEADAVHQPASYGSTSTSQTTSSPRPHPKRKHKTLAHHAHTVPPAKAPTRSGTSGFNNVLGRVLPSKSGSIHRYASQYLPTENGHHDAQQGPSRFLLTDGIVHISNHLCYNLTPVKKRLMNRSLSSRVSLQLPLKLSILLVRLHDEAAGIQPRFILFKSHHNFPQFERLQSLHMLFIPRSNLL